MSPWPRFEAVLIEINGYLQIECALANCPLVDNICVYGRSQEAFCIALMVPNQKHLLKIAEELGETDQKIISLCENDNIKAAVLKKLSEHAKKGKLTKVEIPAAIFLSPEAWTPDTGLLTEALKLKRKPIQKKWVQDGKKERMVLFRYQSVIDELYKKTRVAV